MSRVGETKVSASAATSVALNTCLCVAGEMTKHAYSAVFGTTEAGSARYTTGLGAQCDALTCPLLTLNFRACQ